MDFFAERLWFLDGKRALYAFPGAKTLADGPNFPCESTALIAEYKNNFQLNR
jgi:hypothetical protein